MKTILHNFLVTFVSISLFCSFSTPDCSKEIPARVSNSDIKMLSSFLYSANGSIADGNRVVFGPNFSNAVDANDAIKLTNPGENFGLLRDSRKLAVEARQPIDAGDTLYFDMANLHPQIYRLEIVPQNLAIETVSCILYDRFLNATHTITLADSNHFTLEVTSDPASSASNRLMVIFRNTVTVLPVYFKSITGSIIAERSIRINWQVLNETDIATYDVEKSIDGFLFTKMKTVLPVYKNETGGNYELIDQQAFKKLNFYRIKSTDKTGEVSYSGVIEIAAPKTAATLSVYPNPVTESKFELNLKSVTPGDYLLQISNMMGQPVYTKKLTIQLYDHREMIRIPSTVGKGNYVISVNGNERNNYHLPLLIK